MTVIEPGYFRTDFLDASSLSVSSRIIEDYNETAGKVRRIAIGLSSILMPSASLPNLARMSRSAV